jgi:hypothetical protein
LASGQASSSAGSSGPAWVTVNVRMVDDYRLLEVLASGRNKAAAARK